MPSFGMILLNVFIGAALAAGTNKWAIDLIINRVLPKKKSVFARSIQNVVSGELLTPEKMRGKLDDPQVADLFRRNLDDALAAFLDRDLSSPDTCFAQHRDDLDRIVAQLRDFVLDELSARCATPAFRDDIIQPWLAREWEAIVHRSPRSLLPKPTTDFTAAVGPWVTGLQESGSLRRNLSKALTGWLSGRLATTRTLDDLLPPTFRNLLLDWIEEQTPLVGEQLAAALETPELQTTVSDAVLSALREQLDSQGPFGRLKNKMANWIGVEDDIRGFCRRLPATLRQTLDQPDRRQQLKKTLRATTESWLRKELTTEFRSPAQHERLAGLLIDHLWRPETFAELARHATRLVDEATSRSLQETAFRLGLDADAATALDTATEKIQQTLTAPATRALLSDRIDEAITTWRQQPLGRLQRFLPPSSRERISALAADETRRLIQARLADFADQSGIWNIVTESIEGYSDKELGDLIRNLAREEFKKITWLGAAVGAIVGFLQSFLPS